MLRSFNSRCAALFLIVVSGFSALAWRLIEIQYFERQYFEAQAVKNKTSYTLLHGGRGHILDRNDELIARSVTEGKLWIDRVHLDDFDRAARALAWDECAIRPNWNGLSEKIKSQEWKKATRKIQDDHEDDSKNLTEKYLAYAISHIAPAMRIKREDMRALIDSKSNLQYFPIATDLDEAACDRIQEALTQQKIHGFELIKTARRRYASPDLAAHIIGYTTLVKSTIGNMTYDKEVGNFGVEKALEKYLAGRDGYRKSTTNPSGDIIGDAPGVTHPPRSGFNVMLTLDMDIQTILQEELAAAIKEYKAPRGSIIVMDPQTGELLGMANYPSFNLKTLENINTNSLNFSTQMVYEPGSTIKAIAFAAGLNERVISRYSPINCHYGYYKRGNFEMEDHHSYGVISAEWVIGKSSNIGSFMIADRYGMSKHYDYLSAFGFGKRTGIELSGEQPGYFDRSDNLTTFASMTYGYAINVTPLQMASAYSVIANGGKLYKPNLLKAVIANDGTVVDQPAPQLIRQVISPQAAKEARIGMKTVLSKEGTATQAVVPGYDACGKTGTAKKYEPAVRDPKTKKIIRKGYYHDHRYTCSFAGMLPANDPKFVCVVVIDDPRAGHVQLYGGTIAGPIFSRVCSRVAQHLHLTPTVAADLHVAN